MSRAARPKQFLALTGPESLFQQTLRRVEDSSIYAPAIVVTHADYRFIAAEQAAEIGASLSGVLLEPVARNTAIAIAAAAAYACNEFGPDVVLHVLPSDHQVAVDDGYRRSLTISHEAALRGSLVTFGIAPTRPETGYGYIQAAATVGEGTAPVLRFLEKPDKAQAERLLAEGGYFWNSGMFMFAASTFLHECDNLAPETAAAAHQAVQDAKKDLDFVRLSESAYGSAPNISVDYAIFEKTERAAVVAVDFAWSDLGSWDAVWATSPRDQSNNVSLGPVTLGDVKGSLVIGDTTHVVVDGLEDVAVIASSDAVYVGRLSEAQHVGAMVKTLKANRETAGLTETHRTSYRPWGGYTSVANGERFQVKRLFVKPGKKLSLQKHHHRSEHWVVVRGTAEVTVDDQVTMVSENQSIYLPLGCTHRLCNPGKIELELIEVQTGSYLGEDDIIRIEDEFGRT